MNKTQAQQAINLSAGKTATLEDGTVLTVAEGDQVATHVGGTTWKVRNAEGNFYRVVLENVKRGEAIPEVLQLVRQPEPKQSKAAKLAAEEFKPTGDVHTIGRNHFPIGRRESDGVLAYQKRDGSWKEIRHQESEVSEQVEA